MAEYPIHDMFIKRSSQVQEPGSALWEVLSFQDHLLRRFGFIQAVLLEPEYSSRPYLRTIADELIFVLEGRFLVSLKDLRTGSPSEGASYHGRLISGDLLLVPFGVVFGCQTESEGSTHLRISTHEISSEAEIQYFDWKSL